jgi:hypothetical protein
MMYDAARRGRGAASSRVREADRPVFLPPIDTEEIFRKLIADELRTGRLTRAHRRRIVQYAAQMGLSATQAGRLVEACREQALHSTDPTERRYALRLVEPPPKHTSTRFKIALVVTAAVVLNALLIYTLR